MGISGSLSFLAGAYTGWYLLSKGLFNPQDIPVLLYHDVSYDFYWTFSRVTPLLFKRQMQHLNQHGYHTISVDDYLTGEHSPKSFMLTFDDGYTSIVDKALPVLSEFNMTGVVFVVTGFMGKYNQWDVNLGGYQNRHMDWEQVEKLIDCGWEIGSHSHNHLDFTQISLSQIQDEISQSQQEIHKYTGKSPRLFSYPFGRCHPQAAEAVRTAGFKAGFTSYPRTNLNLNRWAIGRRPVYLLDTRYDVMARVEPSAWKNLYYDWLGRGINFFAGGVGLYQKLIKPRF